MTFGIDHEMTYALILTGICESMRSYNLFIIHMYYHSIQNSHKNLHWNIIDISLNLLRNFQQ
jgi:hypothetical protein